MTPGQRAIARVKAKRKRLIQSRLNRIADLIGETAFLLRLDYPEGALFVEGEGSISALTDTHDIRREQSILASARFNKADCQCGAW